MSKFSENCTIINDIYNNEKWDDAAVINKALEEFIDKELDAYGINATHGDFFAFKDPLAKDSSVAYIIFMVNPRREEPEFAFDLYFRLDASGYVSSTKIHFNSTNYEFTGDYAKHFCEVLDNLISITQNVVDFVSNELDI